MLPCRTLQAGFSNDLQSRASWLATQAEVAFLEDSKLLDGPIIFWHVVLLMRFKLLHRDSLCILMLQAYYAGTELGQGKHRNHVADCSGNY